MSVDAPRRVVHLLGSLDRGGAETVALDLVRQIPATEAQQQFICLSGRPGDLAPQFVQAGASVKTLDLRDPLFPFRFWRTLRTYRPDTVVSHVSLASGWLLLIALTLGIQRRVARMHSEGDGRAATRSRALYRAVSRSLLVRVATNIVAVSNASLAFALPRRSRSAPPGKCSVLPNGVDMKRFRLREASASNQLTIAHIGRADPVKNRVKVVEVHRELRRRRVDHRCLLVGPRGTDDLEGVDLSGVEVTGPTDDVPELLQNVDVILLPSFREGQPGIVLEALASGVPVVGSDIPALRELAAKVHGITLCGLQEGAKCWADAVLSVGNIAEEERQKYRDDVERAGMSLEASVLEWKRIL